MIDPSPVIFNGYRCGRLACAGTVHGERATRLDEYPGFVFHEQCAILVHNGEFSLLDAEANEQRA